MSSQQKKPFSLLVSYIYRALKILFYIPDHIKLNDVLKYFSASGFVADRTYYVYLSTFLSYSLSTESRLKILINHYQFTKENFPLHILKFIFCNGLKCWSETRGKDKFEISLVTAYPYDTEGKLSLVFKSNDIVLYTISFTFSKGHIFGLIDDQVIYVTRIQGTKESLEAISAATKIFNDNALPVLLMSALEGLALSLGIKSIVGLSLRNKIGNAISEKSFQKNYDEFWKTFESVKISNNDYFLSLPLQNKPLSLIKSKHRSRVVAKRKIRRNISRKTYLFFSHKVLTPKKVRISSHLRIIKKEIKATA